MRIPQPGRWLKRALGAGFDGHANSSNPEFLFTKLGANAVSGTAKAIGLAKNAPK